MTASLADSFAAYAQAGSLILLLLALLHGLVWHVLRLRWALLLALGFGMGAALYGFDAQLRPGEGQGHPVGSTLGVAMLLLQMMALADYAQLPQRTARALLAMALVVGLGLLALRLSGVVPRIVGSVGYGLSFLVSAGLVAWAWRREPNSGHGLVLASLLLHPLIVLGVLVGWFDARAPRYLALVPAIVVGMTILATGLLRAQRMAESELQRRRQAEDALRALNESLEQRVAQRTRELRDMVTGLESFNRSVSHDLRGPLGGIAGVARLATEAVARGDLLTVQRLLSVVTAQAESSSQLVEALLALAKVGDGELAPETIDLGRFVRETLEQMRLADPASIEVPVELHPLPQVQADPALLRQVLVNLLGNAQKFSRQAPRPRVEVGAETDGDGGTVLYVRDNGLGFDESQAEALFQPFQRLHGAQIQGDGVGLSIVKRIVERHGGRVWARSRPGAGATFCFTLGAAGRRP